MDFESGYNMPDDPGPVGGMLESVLEQMLQAATQRRVDTRMSGICTTVYAELNAIEPEQRTADQAAVMRFFETMHYVTYRSLGMVDRMDDPLEIEDYKAQLRVKAHGLHADYVKTCMHDDGFNKDVGGDIREVLKGIVE